MDDGVDALCRDSVPASEDGDGVPVTRPVVPVLIQPVPAVAEEISAEPHRRLPAVVSLLANPVKCGIEGAFTGTLKKKSSHLPLGAKTSPSYFYM